MASGVNVKMGVSGVSQFKASIREVQQSVRTLDQALALNEKQFKATGDAETYMKDKSDLLQRKLEKQEEIVKKAKKALDDMAKNGADKASSSYQKMQQELLKAEGNLLDTRTAMNNIGTAAGNAGKKADEMDTKLNNIGKGVAWENVTNGLGKVIDKLESGARAAINFGKRVLDSAKDATKQADEIKTTVDQYADMGLTADSYQRMQKVAEFIDTPVEAILTARQRMQKALAGDTGKKTLEETLGITLNGQSAEDLFWEAGDALMKMGEDFDKEAAAQQLFGRSWRELLPLLKTGRDEYNKMMAEQSVLSDEQIEKLAQADDAIKRVEQQVELLKNQFWAENADKITDMMQWLVDNKEAVVSALAALATAFGALKLGEAATNVGKLVSGFKELNLLKSGGPAAGAEAGATGGTAGGGTGIGGGGWWGLAGTALIAAGFEWAKNQRNNHGDQVRGTDANLAAQSMGAEGALLEYIRANKAMADIDLVNAAAEEVEAMQARIEAARQSLEQAEGGAEALQAYSDWRQEHSYGNMDWEIPETLERMENAVAELTGATETQSKGNSEMTEAANGLKGLPGDIRNALERTQIRAYILGSDLAPFVNSTLGQELQTEIP